LLRVGQGVEVTYADSGSSLHASRIRSIAQLGDGTGDERSTGTVKSISATTLTISGWSGKASFTQTFAIDAKTNVVGKGVGTHAASKGGRIAITDVVSVGDSVSVWYHKVGGDSLQVSEVRVTSKSAASR
jgi:hypothetical protein